MSEAYKCDRCLEYQDGSPYDIDPTDTDVAGIILTNTDGCTADVCEPCLLAMDKAWKEGSK